MFHAGLSRTVVRMLPVAIASSSLPQEGGKHVWADHIDLTWHHDLEAFSPARRVGHGNFVGHQAVLCRPDHAYGWFSGALDDKGLESGSQR
jgi:hypothetical protein